MRPTSIIFLVVSVLLIIAGLITVGVANQLAASEGIVLIEKADTDSSVFTYDYSQDGIAKLIINVRDADINIIGGSAKPYIELVNFFEGTYEFSSINRILTVKDSSDLSTAEGIGSFITGFKGLRGIVNQYNSRGLEKTVNVYISAAYPVNVTDCSVESGDVSISSIGYAADYLVDIGTGNLSLVSVETTSKVRAEIDEGDVSMDNCRIADFTAELKYGGVDANAKLYKVDADIEHGDFVYYTKEQLGVTGFAMTCTSGSISINGENFGGYRVEENASTENILDITVGKGNIIVTSRE